MKHRPIIRAAVRSLGVLLTVCLLYVVSSGPAIWWVVSAVSGKDVTEANVAIYDKRLSTYFHLYSPIISFGYWLRYHDKIGLSQLFWKYDRCFVRPRKLADGREVTTIFGPSPRAGESTSQYVERMTEGYLAQRPGTKVFALPLSHPLSGLSLLVVDPSEDELIPLYLSPASRNSVTSYVELELP